MKKLLFLNFAALCILIASCSKDSGFMPGSDPGLAYGKGNHINCPVVIYKPAADGDDTDEFLAIINGALPGTVIKLEEGVYHLGYMEVTDFHGSIVGAGVDRTIIYPVTPLTYEVQFSENIVPCWMRFTSGDFCISQMTFNTDVIGPIHDYSVESILGEDLFSIFVLADYNDKHRFDEPYQKVTFKNVNLIGGTDDGINGYLTNNNTLIGIWCGSDFWWPIGSLDYPLTRGEFTITDCYFHNFLDAVEGFGLGEYGMMKISRCRLDYCLWPLYFTANHGSKIYISDNTFSRSLDSDVIIEDIDFGVLTNTYINPQKRSQFTLTGNIFNVKSPVSSVIMWDTYVATSPEKVPPMIISLKGNIFNLTEGSTGVSAINSQDAVIQNNKFRGSCNTGILIDGISTDRYGKPLPLEVNANNVLVLGNNFTGLNATNADIVLGDNSSNCTVVGNGKESVIDDGTNNKIVGMKKKPGSHHIGPSIRDNFRMWHGMRNH